MNRNLFRTCTLIGALGALAACGGDTTAPKTGISPSAPQFALNTPENGGGACMGDDSFAFGLNGMASAADLNCTSKDVRIAKTIITSYSLDNITFTDLGPNDRVKCVPGDVIYAQTSALVVGGAQSRWDVGVWIATDEGTAVTGQCDHFNLVTPTNDLTPGNDFSSGVTDLDDDSCGDLTQGDTAKVVLGLRTFQCEGTEANPDVVSVGSCLGWLNSEDPGSRTSSVCPIDPPGGATGFRWGTTPETKAKCNCEPMLLPIDIQGVLHIVKQTIPDGDATSFSFTTTGTGYTTPFSLTDGQDHSSGPLSAGTYTATETVPTGWTLTSRACVVTGTTDSKTFTPTTDGISVAIAAGENVTCTFTNTKKSSITITKVTVPASDPQDFAFTTSGTGLSNFSLDTDAGDNLLSNTTTFNNLAAGSYSVTESAVSGWDLTDLTCVDPTTNTTVNTATGVATIDLAAGESVSCTYTNTKRGSVVIKKETSPDGVSGSFSFTQNVDGSGSFSLSDNGSKTFTNVAPNTSTGYTVTEGATTGFKLQSLSCDNPDGLNASSVAGAVATIKVNAGETVTCTYTNLQLATLELRKVENGGLPLSRAWSFELRTGASIAAAGTVVASASANVTTGVIAFSGYFDPGVYQLCETGMPVGYSNNITGFTPLGATPEGGDNSTECIQITLVSGANGPGGITGVPNPINNLRPPTTGAARTIGYWKNWSSCTGGNQYKKADARHELNTTLDYYLPTGLQNSIYPFGDIAGPLSCDQAVRLLSKSDMNTGKKMASDPAYNLAAQLLAAKLNLAATGACADAITAINAGQALLDAINFTGTGTYANKMTAQQKTLANQLATTLDQFNNNLLCP